MDVYGSRWNKLGPAFEVVRRDRIAVTIDGVTLTPLPGAHGVDGVICVPTAAADTPADALWTAHVEHAPGEPTGKASLGAEVPAKARGRRVLLIEDNDQAACALKVALEQLGYTVAIAHDGPVALYMASTFDPDVALVDIGLPVMDGWELAARLRERVSHHALHFLAVTARDRPADKDRSMASGFVEHLVKPIDVGSLHRAIERLPERS